MLKKEVVEAAAAGRFHIYAVDTIDEAIELLTQTVAGVKDAEGNYPEGSVSSLVAARLLEFSRIRLEYASWDTREKMIAKPDKRSTQPKAP